MRMYLTTLELAAIRYAVQYALKENEGRGKYPVPVTGAQFYADLLRKLDKKVPSPKP